MWFGKVDERIFCERIVRSTVSNALVRSSETRIVRCGGLGWLKPAVMACVVCCSAVMVEWFCLKPC